MGFWESLTAEIRYESLKEMLEVVPIHVWPLLSQNTLILVANQKRTDVLCRDGRKAVNA